MIYGVILAGGRGERFWPLSRTSKPKQFLKLTSNQTMLEETLQRVRPMIPTDKIRIVAGEAMTEQIMASTSNISRDHILTEPMQRNTCLAIGLAAAHLVKEDPHATMVVLTADHLIRPAEKLLNLLEQGAAIAASEKRLITLGIVPTRPDTGYGYIKFGERFGNGGFQDAFEVDGFTEKPKAVVAQEYYYSRQYLWNSGMFIWSAQVILDEIKKCQPEMGQQLEEYMEKIGTPEQQKAIEELYEKAVSISIDYAVLERTKNVLVIKADIVWDDVGSWNSLERYMERDKDNNVLVGEAQVLDSFETTIYNDGDGIIAALGVSDLVVVRSGEITFVAHKTKLDSIKKLLAEMAEHEDRKRFL